MSEVKGTAGTDGSLTWHGCGERMTGKRRAASYATSPLSLITSPSAAPRSARNEGREPGPNGTRSDGEVGVGWG